MNQNLEAQEYFQQARVFFGNDQNELAIEYIDKAIAQDRMNVEYYLLKGVVLAGMERYDEAKTELEKALKVDRKCAEAYFHLGNIALLQGDQIGGVENFNKAIANGFDDAQIYFNLGLMYEEQGNEELALRNYSKAILKDPLRVDARVRKAKLYISANQYPEALETLDALILADPDLYDGYHLKTLLLAEMGRLDEAFTVLEDAIALFPKDPAFLLDKVNLLVLQENAEQAKAQIAQLENGYTLEPHQKRQLCLEKSRLFALDGDLEGVIGALKEAKACSAQADDGDLDPEATFLLVNCYLEIKDYDGAIECSRELLTCDYPEFSIPAYYTLPYAYAQRGDTEKAQGLYKEAVSKLRSITLENPAILDAYLFRALCLKELGAYDKAMELSDYLLKMDPKSKEFHNLKAEILYAMGKEEEAKAEKAAAESL